VGKAAIILALIWIPSAAFAVSLQAPAANIDAERHELALFFDDLAKSARIESRPSRYIRAASGAGSAPAAASLRDRACTSPARVNATLESMKILAMIAAQSVGSGSQQGMAQNLQLRGQQLSASDSPVLQQQGALLQQESAALAMGDPESAQGFAQEMQALPSVAGSGPPSAADQAYAAELRQADQQAAESAAMSFGAEALQALGAWLQSQSSSSNSAGSASGGDAASGFVGAALSGIATTMAKGNSGPRSSLGQGVGANGASGCGYGSLGMSRLGSGGQNSMGGPLGAPLQAPSGGADIPVAPGNGSASGGALPGTSL